MHHSKLFIALFALACTGSSTSPSRDAGPGSDAGAASDAASDAGSIDDAGMARLDATDPTDGGAIGGNGMHRITVPLPSGGSDEVWIYAAAPPAGADLPVVVYGHGLNVELTNCAPEAGPGGFDSFTSVLGDHAFGVDSVAELLAEEGYLGIAVLYRNKGDGAPGVGRVRVRDHHLRDASALLAAAAWARDVHGRGSDRVAVIGFSMGTWPAMWAGSDAPELASLQAGLDLRTVVLQGQTANHLTNAAEPGCGRGELPIGTYAILEALGKMVDEVRVEDLRGDTVVGELVAELLLPLGVDLFEEIYFMPSDTTLTQCLVEDIPAICSRPCFRAMIARRTGGAMPDDRDLYRAPMFEAADLLCELSPTAGDPGVDHPNPVIRTMRAGSPALSANAMIVPRVLPLFAAGDSHYHEASLELLTRRLVDMDVITPATPIPLGEECEHGNYLSRGRPQCGLDHTLEELTLAFAE
jgi:hypothetical protein